MLLLLLPLLLLVLLLLFAPLDLLLASAATTTTSMSIPGAGDAQALLDFKFKADPSDHLYFPTNTSHCRWPGVQCSSSGRVVRLVLEDFGLSGLLPPGTIDQLDQLRILSLQSNSLSGPIPDLSLLPDLKALFLSRNRFHGPFPPSVFSLRRLRILDLSFNGLSGPIPPRLAAQDRLYSLRLDSNRFNGSLPPLNQSSLKYFNVSGNMLSGPVPVTMALSAFGPDAFAGNPGLCGAAVRRECPSNLLFFGGHIAPAPATVGKQGAGGQQQLEGFVLPGGGGAAAASPASGRMRKRATIAVGFLAGGLFLVGLVGISLALSRKSKKNRMLRQGKMLSPHKNGTSDGVDYVGNDGDSGISCSNANNNNESAELEAAAGMMSEEKVKKLGKSGCLVFCAGEAPVYTLEQLMRASAEMLGRGSIGTTYKAVLDNRLIVTVKRVDAAKLGMAGKEAFERQMDVVGRLRHPNLVPLRSYFQAKEERLLVYDYQANGSLFSLIHGSKSTRAKPLHWTSCLKIAEDVGQGLAYIHQASRLVHGNIKSSNILLGSDFEACLTDNCLSCLVEPSDGEDDSGYRAPETRKSNRRLTPRSDIYAFGVLLLELLTGKPPLQHPVLIATDLPVWVRSVRVDEGAVDERLMMLIEIATACVRSSPESRPTTWQVLKMIQEVKEVDAGDDDLDSSSIS